MSIHQTARWSGTRRSGTRRTAVAALVPLCAVATATPAAAAPARLRGAFRAVPALVAKPELQRAGAAAPLRLAHAVSPASVASAARPAFTGYLWSTSPAPPPIDDFHAFDSAGGSMAVSHPATGRYTVTFGLKTFLPVPAVHVTTYGAPANCDVVGLLVQTSSMTVNVNCYSLSGAAAEDATFDLLAGEPGARPAGTVDYATILEGHIHFSGNSSQRANKVTRLGVGRYQLVFGGPATKGVTGTVQVTTFNLGGNCVVPGWHGTSAGELVDVDCFSASGHRADDSFIVGYARRGNLTGVHGAATADAFASRPTAARYQPMVQDDDTAGAHVTVRRQATGQYVVMFTGSGGRYSQDGGDVQVSAAGTSDTLCYVVSWSGTTSPQAMVNCVDNLGNPVDSAFAIQWVND
jgi:hypothetical protein